LFLRFRLVRMDYFQCLTDRCREAMSCAEYHKTFNLSRIYNPT
jgi:hypothetical protein